MIINSKKILNN